MSMFASLMRLLHTFTILGVVLHGVPLAAQVITVDWAKKEITRGRELLLDKPTKVRVEVVNANTFLYNYRVAAIPVRVVIDDASILSSVFPAALPSSADPCTAAIKDLQGVAGKLDPAIGSFRNVCSAKGCESRPYKDSWKAYVESIEPLQTELMQKEKVYLDKCTDHSLVDKPAYKKTKLRLEQYTKAAAGALTPAAEVTVGPGFGLQIDVTEVFTTDSGEEKETAKFADSIEDVGKPVLFLSAGVLLTKIESREYSKSEIPGVSGKVLGVQASGWPRPLGVALLNYSIPGIDSYLQKGNLGLNLAFGPTIQFSSGKSDLSNFGLFVGVSLDLWKRLFITPGVHVGQFADFPDGFQPRDRIPDQFGDLNPQKRATGRFGVVISVRAKSFDNLFGGKEAASKGGGSKKSGGEGKEEAKPPKEEPKDTPKSKPAKDRPKD